MPYIKPVRRHDLSRWDRPRNAGDLNYLFTRTIAHYVKSQGLSYQTINDIVGALDCASHEFKRRIADPYEDQKIEENGDVYQDILP